MFRWLYYTIAQEEFEDLCFKFGIELDDVVSPPSLQFLLIDGIHIPKINQFVVCFWTLWWWYQTTEKAIIRKERHLDEEDEEVGDDEEIIYKIEVPANRLPSLSLPPILILIW